MSVRLLIWTLKLDIFYLLGRFLVQVHTFLSLDAVIIQIHIGLETGLPGIAFSEHKPRGPSMSFCSVCVE